jgi:hypothetical protein
VNAKGSSSRRVYDAHTGRKVGETRLEPGDFGAAFADDIAAGVMLNSGLDEQQLEEWNPELPMTILDELNGDLKTARAEMPSRETHSAPHTT